MRLKRPGGSFRQKLLLTFLLMGMIPALALTIFYLHYLAGSIELWQNPGVENLLQSSLALARESLTPLELSSERMSAEVAAGGRLLSMLAGDDQDGVRDLLGRVLSEEEDDEGGNVPFIFVLRRPEDSDGWSLWTAAGPVPPPEGEMSFPAPGPPSLASDIGVVWCSEEVGTGWMVVSGWRLDPATAERARALATSLPLYRSLGAYKRVQLRTAWAATGILFLILALASWLVARALAGNISGPIVKLVDGTRRVAGGDYEHRVSGETSDELGRLVTAFNWMIGELSDQAEKLRQAERIAAWREIARRVAHQIKNPLTPIQLSVHRLRALEPEAGSREEKLLEECLDAVTGEVHNLRRIADEFSRFARLPEPSPRKTALGSLVREVTELYHSGHPEIRLELEVEPDLPPAFLDPDLTRQALSNLVKNAVEAMPEGGELRVKVGSIGGFHISVSDTGGGLPPEVRERLFTPYLTTKPGGTGLGLALAHRMVVDQGGTLEVLTEEGHGTTFVIDFPREPVERTPDDPPGES